ncbi:MAG: glycosyltransferase family 2 protein, partial [Coprobacter sp.]|nr:glycosyltransferase family 2 protein [Coprobacter sp.]
MKFSIIVPVYNRRAEVEELLESLSKQTDKDFETIIVEDGSIEDSEDIAKRYAESANVRYFMKKNEGRSAARNYGMERAEGEWFIFFDSDCVIPPTYFEIVKRE